MKRILFLAYTPFQVIASLAIRVQYYPEDIVDIILLESVQSREQLKKQIFKYKIFEKVYLPDIRIYSVGER